MVLFHTDVTLMSSQREKIMFLQKARKLFSAGGLTVCNTLLSGTNDFLLKAIHAAA
jgi:hypothetical protein